MNDTTAVLEDYQETQWKAASSPRELSADQVDINIDVSQLKFDTTAEVEPLNEIIGQDRALAAVDVGVGIAQEGYNIFVVGLTGIGKMETVRKILEKRLGKPTIPSDWVYLNNFDNPDEPWAVELPPGKGRQLKKDMERLVERLKDGLPKAFRQEDFSQEKERLGEKYNTRFQQQMERLAKLAKDREFQMTPSPEGNLFFVPLIDGSPPHSEEELEALPDEAKERIRDGQKELSREAARVMQGQRDMMQQLGEEVREVERRFGTYLVRPMIDFIKQSYADQPRILTYLDHVAEHTLNNLADFREGGRPSMIPGPMPGLMMPTEAEPRFTEYEVNVIVDNSQTTTAPILVEETPTYRNLFGSIERAVDRSGRLVTNFTQIKAGCLLKANGGYLVFNLEDALTEPFVYKSLKRALKSGQIQLETYDPWLPFTAGSLRPEPIAINTKVIVLGDLSLYYFLRFHDEEFSSIFKIRADFGHEMPRSPREQFQYARFISMIARDEKLHPFSREAVAEIIRFGSRQAEQKEKLLAQLSEVADVLREANYFAGKQVGDGQVVGAEHVRQALESRIYRSDRIAEKIRELIADGTLLIDVEGSRVGQVNGLAVLDTGDFAFGRPNRVTTSVGLGSEGLINIEREAKLSGSTYDKGMLILSGYIRNQYGKNMPLALSASITFEQSYGGVDGDSASSTELYALLSNLAGLPMRQDIAATGSVNQWGQVQAIGGVNEKIEGFYDVCRVVGLTGEQGVCIPESNIKNLVLRDDVRKAIAEGQFHIYPVTTIDEGLELLSGIRAGSIEEEGTIHWAVYHRLQAMAQGLKAFGALREAVTILPGNHVPPQPVPPRLPGDQP